MIFTLPRASAFPLSERARLVGLVQQVGVSPALFVAPRGSAPRRAYGHGSFLRPISPAQPPQSEYPVAWPSEFRVDL
jgi:hypothetical protein